MFISSSVQQQKRGTAVTVTIQLQFHLGVTLLSGLRASWPQGVFCKVTCRILLTFSRVEESVGEAFARKVTCRILLTFSRVEESVGEGVGRKVTCHILLTFRRVEESVGEGLGRNVTCRILLTFSRVARGVFCKVTCRILLEKSTGPSKMLIFQGRSSLFQTKKSTVARILKATFTKPSVLPIKVDVDRVRFRTEPSGNMRPRGRST